jgi:hypothetical protein
MKKQGLDKAEYRRLWDARLVDLEESGLTQQRWCEQNNISYSTLKYWIIKINKEKKRIHEADDKWLTLEVGIPPAKRSAGTPNSGKVSVNYGPFRVDIDDGANPEQVYNILRVLKEL